MPVTARFFSSAEAARLLSRLCTLFISRDIRGFLVGGYLRDGLLGRETHDIDIVVESDAMSAAGEATQAFGGSLVRLHEGNQIARVVILDQDQRWYLDFAAMRGTLQNDLRLRDFTVDAIAAELSEKEPGWHTIDLIDPLGGLGDLQESVVRSTNEEAFVDDPARLLRAFRLSAELEFVIDPHTEDLIEHYSSLISSVSGERVRDELMRVLETSRAAPTLREIDRLGLLDRIIPELTLSKGVEQPKEHFWDVFEHTLQTVAAVERLLTALNSEEGLLEGLTSREALVDHFGKEIVVGRSRRTLLKLAALLHDVAKPQSKHFDSTGRMRFIGHDRQGAQIAASVSERLRFSSREIRMVSQMVEHHLRPGHLSNAPELPTRRAIYRYFRDTADASIDILFLSLADHLATRGPMFSEEAWRHHVEVTQYMLAKRLEEDITVSPPKLVSGHDLMAQFGLPPGPRIGELLETVREAQAAGEIDTAEGALDLVRKELQENYEIDG